MFIKTGQLIPVRFFFWTVLSISWKLPAVKWNTVHKTCCSSWVSPNKLLVIHLFFFLPESCLQKCKAGSGLINDLMGNPRNPQGCRRVNIGNGKTSQKKAGPNISQPWSRKLHSGVTKSPAQWRFYLCLYPAHPSCYLWHFPNKLFWSSQITPAFWCMFNFVLLNICTCCSYRPT